MTLVVLLLASVPPASAHCDGIDGAILVVDKCTIQQVLEAGTGAVNTAANGTIAFVLVKDFRFHPENITIQDGGTVVWVYADVTQSQQHDPRSSGSCGSQVADMNHCTPTTPGKCFDVLVDNGALLTQPGDYYAVTFHFDGATSLIEKSHGIMSGQPVGLATGAQAFVHCPANTASLSPQEAVIAYHCGVHGGAQTFIQAMRGAIVLRR